jgi:DsbC/DsbD-like thiol-disulfide interchange protein
MATFRPFAFVYVGISALTLLCASTNRPLALESSWDASRDSRTRLISGQLPGSPGTKLAFVEIELAPGWKTYWRTPGDAGGLPPSFDWSQSSNLATANVLYPAPLRLTDKSGDTIGYKGHVVFPVEVRPTDATQPTTLKLDMQYGICKDICIPVDAKLELEIAPDAGDPAPQAAVEAFGHVPRAEGRLKPDDPVLLAAKVDLASAAPRIVLEAKFPGAGGATDIFLEAPESLYVPLPTKAESRGDGVEVFNVDLTAGADVAALKGKTITATLVSPSGASVATFRLE